MNPDFEKLPPGWLDSPLNICVGAAKVPWAQETDDYACGWALPGGKRTQSRDEAVQVAAYIAAALKRYGAGVKMS
jgi:hypothetical protein